jgi:hypothetical protein
MNCRRGDMALIIECEPDPGLVGKLVTCIELAPQRRMRCGRLSFRWGFFVESSPREPIWRVEGARPPWPLEVFGLTLASRRLPYIPDFCLMPLRPPADDTDSNQSEPCETAGTVSPVGTRMAADLGEPSLYGI